MTYDVAPLLAPAQCALLVFECQEGVIGEGSQLPTLAAAARAGALVPNIAVLLAAARAAGAGVFYCKVAKRRDGVGSPCNTPLELRLRGQGSGAPGGPDLGDIVAELAPQPGDVVVSREHGLTGFYESGLDSYLRNTGVRTVVLTGVSVNVGVLGTAIEAVNRGYTVVVPTDCVAGDPPEYAQQALRYSVRNVAFLATGAEIEAVWSASSR
ncbi:MAG: cysteine hydrolase [Deltaproteobacteria bacterium]|nr:cysteine hydrolase [Deltaproteobacteria bacterium]MBW2418347.1 cysteine hydrolase [Deltaproteobacteria bacterium]